MPEQLTPEAEAHATDVLASILAANEGGTAILSLHLALRRMGVVGEWQQGLKQWMPAIKDEELDDMLAKADAEQLAAMEAILLAWDDKVKYSLQGYAGSGKTYIAQVMHRLCKLQGWKLYISAATNDNVAQLRQQGIPEAETLHKTYGLAWKDGNKGAKDVFEWLFNKKHPEYDARKLQRAAWLNKEARHLTDEVGRPWPGLGRERRERCDLLVEG